MSNNSRTYSSQDRQKMNSQTRSYLEALNKQSERLFQKNPKFQDFDNNQNNNNTSNITASNFNYTNNNNNNRSIDYINNLNISAEKTQPTSNYDRDDSLNDVISFGKQTPFRFEIENEPRLNLAGSADYGKLN